MAEMEETAGGEATADLGVLVEMEGLVRAVPRGLRPKGRACQEALADLVRS